MSVTEPSRFTTEVLLPTSRPVAQDESYPPWVPYAVAGTAGICFVVLFVMCFWRYLKPICCCITLCCTKELKEEEHNESTSPPDPEAQDVNNQDGHYSPQERSNSLEKVTIRPPNIPASAVPPRHQLVNAANTQKYIGKLLSTGRRPAQPMAGSSPRQFVAPPAAKQVARTAKIIGDILTSDGRRRRND